MIRTFKKFETKIENFEEILEKLLRYFSNILDKISDNLIKYCG